MVNMSASLCATGIPCDPRPLQQIIELLLGPREDTRKLGGGVMSWSDRIFASSFRPFSVKRPCHVAAATEHQGRITGSASYASAHQNPTPPSCPSGASSPDLALPPSTDRHHPIVSIWTNMPMLHVIEQWARHIWSSPTPGTPVIVPHNNSQRPSMISLSRSFSLTDHAPGPARPLLCSRSVPSGL